MASFDYQNEKASLQDALLKWYAHNGRKLPWRNTSNPYAILVSEVMLQQTQVDRVIPKYAEFLDLFPTIQALAASPLSAVIKIWGGLGYNNRAVHLHKAAEIIVKQYNSNIPMEVEDLKSLPGIGSYTAAAVACFAFGIPVAAFDTNIYRVISRLLFGLVPPSRSEIEKTARVWLPTHSPSNWQQGLMDLGATICTVKNPKCKTCPLYSYCKAGENFQLQGNNNQDLSTHSVPYFPRQSKFKGSTRYYRGKIIAILRGLPATKWISLSKLKLAVPIEISTTSQTSAIDEIVDGLIRDGLIDVAKKRGHEFYYRLP